MQIPLEERDDRDTNQAIHRCAAGARWCGERDPADCAQRRPPPDYGYFTYQTEWGGGPYSLPYGSLVDVWSLLSHCPNMQPVQVGINAMLARGWTRRADTDVAFTQNGHSVVVLGFQKPGTEPDQPGAKQPFLMVVSRSLEIPGVGYVPATQILGMVGRDSAGSILPSFDPADSSLAVVGMTELDGWADAMGYDYPRLNQPLGADQFEDFRYSVHEGASFQSAGYVSPGMQYLSDQCLAQTWSAGLAGAATGLASAGWSPPCAGSWACVGARVSVGFCLGAYSAYNRFWASPPDTNNLPAPYRR